MGSQNNSIESRPELLKGILAGVAGGLLASWVMNQFQGAIHKMVEGEERGHGAQSMQQGSPSHGIADKLKERGIENPDDDAPERLAKFIAAEGFDRRLSAGEKDAGGVALHYAFGAATGAAYGAAAEVLPSVTAGAGFPFGAAVWLAADEVVTPALGLSKKATEYSLGTHAYALASHFVYGLTAEIARRAVRRIL